MEGQPFAFGTLHGGFGALNVADANADAVVIPEVKFSEITVKMFLGAMLINAAHTALENRKRAFNRIRMHVAAYVFLGRMLHGFMRGKERIRAVVKFAFVGMQPSLFSDILSDDAAHRILVANRNME